MLPVTMDRSRAPPARPACRPVHGVLLLDKPAGLTSNQALQTAKRLLAACKAGHTGSLDPIATGLLPLCFGEATKLSQFLLNADKRYWAVLRLGIATATWDREGTVVDTRAVTTSRREIERALQRFEGEIDQRPPMYSAIKQGGQPLYRLAQAGLEVERTTRRVRIHAVKLLSLAEDRLEVEISCSKGTYVRSLAHDLGQLLGCGAHVAELRRLAVGDLDLSRATALAVLNDLPTPEARSQLLLPADRLLNAIPDVRLSSHAAYYLRQGQAVSAQHGHAPGWVRLYDQHNQFLGMGEILDDGRVAPRRLVVETNGADSPRKRLEGPGAPG